MPAFQVSGQVQALLRERPIALVLILDKPRAAILPISGSVIRVPFSIPSGSTIVGLVVVIIERIGYEKEKRNG